MNDNEIEGHNRPELGRLNHLLGNAEGDLLQGVGGRLGRMILVEGVPDGIVALGVTLSY